MDEEFDTNILSYKLLPREYNLEETNV